MVTWVTSLEWLLKTGLTVDILQIYGLIAVSGLTLYEHVHEGQFAIFLSNLQLINNITH